MKIANIAKSLAAAGTLLVMAGPASASMGGLASTLGLLPHDIATAQSMSIFSKEISAAYYNPAALANDPNGSMTAGLLHSSLEMRAESQGGAAPLSRSSDILEKSQSQIILLGLKANASELTTFTHPLYFGFMLAAEENSGEALAFTSETSQSGQPLQYGREPLFITLGFGTKLWRGINIGAGVRAVLQASAKLDLETDLAGNTANEKVDVSATLVYSQNLGLGINMGGTFCGYQHCWMDNLDIAMAHRTSAYGRVKVSADAAIPGIITNPGLQLRLSVIDNFQPATSSIGVRYTFGDASFGFTAEFQNWEELNDILEEDTIHDQANLRFRDTFIPRFGVEYSASDDVVLKAGAAWDVSPLASDTSPDVNYFDGDKLIVGVGFSFTIHNAGYIMMRTPLQLDFAYQFQSISERDFYISDTSGTVNESLTTSGDVHTFVGSFTMKF